MSGQTPSQTVGPYFAYGLTGQQYGYADRQIADGAIGPSQASGRIRIRGRVFDGRGDVIPDALVEFWQADAEGRFGSPEFRGFGRQGTGTDPEGQFRFDTIKPGAAGGGAPFITIIVFMRGLLSHVYTRLYFEDEPEANARDAVLLSVPHDRRATLLARRDGEGAYVFDIHMQGESETVFFDL